MVNRRQVLVSLAAPAAGLIVTGSDRLRAAGTAAPAWRIGTAIADITPPLEAGILMSSGRGAWAPFSGIRAPLHARVLLVQSGRRRVGLVSLDLLGLAGEAVGGMPAFKERIAANADRVIAADELVLAATHTHSGPESLALSELYTTQPFRDWVRSLAERIGAALAEAARSLRPARLAAGVGRAPGLSENRRIRTGRGITVARAVRPTDTVFGPEGPTDDAVRVLAFWDAADQPLAVLVNATAHPVYEMCLKQVSPDYPGELCRILEARHRGARVLFLQGAAGNVNPPSVSSGAEDAIRHAETLAGVVDRVLKQASPVPGSQLALRWRQVHLPARDRKGQPQAEPLRATLGAVLLGEAALVLLPGEPFVEIGLAVAAASPFPLTAVAGYAEEYIGYIPTDRAFDNGGYETGPGRWSRCAPGAEGALREAAVELLKSLPCPTERTTQPGGTHP
ncbi:MAG: hypothetical protein GX575_26840 [Candidatus Anammoximicrobium sp.]|nr:hypothetical protein [Candidatus Anammoximicrobium sp.]